MKKKKKSFVFRDLLDVRDQIPCQKCCRKGNECHVDFSSFSLLDHVGKKSIAKMCYKMKAKKCQACKPARAPVSLYHYPFSSSFFFFSLRVASPRPPFSSAITTPQSHAAVKARFYDTWSSFTSLPGLRGSFTYENRDQQTSSSFFSFFLRAQSDVPPSLRCLSSES